MSAPEGYKLAGCANVASKAGRYLLTTRGGDAYGDGGMPAAIEAIARHGYVAGDWVTRHIPTAGETMSYAELYERDWSMAP